MLCRIALSSILLLTLQLVPSGLAAQHGQTSALRGVVRDVSGQPLAGATLTLDGPHLIGGAQTAASDERGGYRFVALLPGTFTLSVKYPGFSTVQRTGIELVAGIGATLDFTLHASPVEALVQVAGTAPAVDVRSSASPQLVERTVLEHLPLESREVSRHINLAPGIAGNVAYGGAASANALFVDGTSATSPVQGTPDAAPVVYWLDSLQIISLGASAEHGEYSTATLNAVIRSGTNRFSGRGDHVWTRRAWARWRELLEWRDTSGQFSGPLWRGHLWFFGGYDDQATVSRVTAFLNQPRSSDEPLVEQREWKSLLKISSAPTPGMRLEGYVSEGRGSSRNGNASPFVTADALGSFHSGRSLSNLRWTWPATTRTLFELHYGGFSARNGQGPTDPARRGGPAPHRDQATGVFSINYPQIVDAARHVHSARGTVTHHVPAVYGEHELKAGLEHERARVREDLSYPDNTFYLDRNGQPELVRFWEGSHFRPAHYRTSLFVRDSWRLGRVTIEPGVRLGFYRSRVSTPASPTYSNSSVSPRVGAAWDLAADHRSVVRVHYGHYHDPMATRFYEYLDAEADSPFIVARVLGEGRFEEVSRTGGPTNVPTIDPATKHSFAEEWLAGVEHEPWPRVSLKAQYVRRSTRNTIGFVDVASRWRPVEALDPGPDGRPGTDDDGRPLTIFINEQSVAPRYLLTNPDGAWRRYDGIQFVGSRRFHDGWSVQASYAWARTRGSFDNDNGSNAANTDLATNGNFANPNRAINATGRTLYDWRHDVRVFGTLVVPSWGGVQVSGVYRYTSGAPWGRIVNSFDPRTQSAILVEPVGTRHMPATSELDLRIEKTVSFRKALKGGLFADIFNLTNREVPRYQQISGSAFGTATSWTQPRRFRLGLRVSF